MDTALLYKIFWYINNATNPFRTSKIVTKDDLHLAYLTVDNGLNTITLGIQVKYILFIERHFFIVIFADLKKKTHFTLDCDLHSAMRTQSYHTFKCDMLHAQKAYRLICVHVLKCISIS